MRTRCKLSLVGEKQEGVAHSLAGRAMKPGLEPLQLVVSGVGAGGVFLVAVARGVEVSMAAVALNHVVLVGAEQLSMATRAEEADRLPVQI